MLRKNMPAHGGPYDSGEDAERPVGRSLETSAEVTVIKTGWLSRDRNRGRLSLSRRDAGCSLRLSKGDGERDTRATHRPGALT